jgi:hypothetical protein
VLWFECSLKNSRWNFIDILTVLRGDYVMSILRLLLQEWISYRGTDSWAFHLSLSCGSSPFYAFCHVRMQQCWCQMLVTYPWHLSHKNNKKQINVLYKLSILRYSDIAAAAKTKNKNLKTKKGLRRMLCKNTLPV